MDRLAQVLPDPRASRAGPDGSLDAEALENAAAMLEALCDALSTDEHKGSVGVAARSAADKLERADRVEGLRGSSRAITIPELLSFVAGSYKQGLLRIRTPEASFLIQVEAGTVTDARCDHLAPGEYIGAVLVSIGALSATDLERLEASVGRRQEALLPALLAEGLISAADAAQAAEEQIRILFRRLGGTAKAEFWFYEEVRPLSNPRVRLNVTKLLLDGARLEDEESQRHPETAAEPAPATTGEMLALDERVEKHALGILLRLLKDEEAGLPLLDATAYELLGMCWDENTDAHTLKERIDFDLGISAHLLRVANSSLYAPVVPVTSVQLAISRLGMDNIRDIVLTIIVRNKMFSVHGQEQATREIWRRSALRCSFAQAICKKSRSSTSRGTTVSLLLDIGQPVVLSSRGKLEQQLGGRLSDDGFTALAQKLHPPVGAELVRRWSMPSWLETVIRLQRTPSKCVEYSDEAWLAHMADRMAAWCAAKDSDVAEEIAGDSAWLELGLSAHDVQAIFADAAQIERHAEIYL